MTFKPALALLLGCACSATLVASDKDSGGGTPVISGTFRGVLPVVRFNVSEPLRDIHPAAIPYSPMLTGGATVDPPSGLEWLFPPAPQRPDLIVQGSIGARGSAPAPLVSFDGNPNVFGFNPPDPAGDVGPNHYVAMTNVTTQIFDKTGTSLLGPVANNTLWSGLGGRCEVDNSGDPIVIYNQFDDRWILTQFTDPNQTTFFLCVAVSTTPDPTGSYYQYAISTGSAFPDYPKFGMWRDALYVSTREFGGPNGYAIGAYALNRAQLMAGNPALQTLSFLVTTPAFDIGDGLLPADADGSVLPPVGAPAYFVGAMDDGGAYGAPQDALTLWKFVANFTTPASSSFTLTDTINIASYNTTFPCTPSSRSCIPQPDTTRKVDIQSYRQRPLHRLAYRNFGTHESLVTNQSVDAGMGMAGIRWWEIRNPAGTPVLHQEGTYAPGVTDGVHRWMGSVAMDFAGNMGLGYSASSSTVYPSVRYTGRLAGDPLGTMPQGEGEIVAGTGSNTSSSSRWGDYTSMNIDPVDDCTFWYVNQYTPVTSNAGWRLRIGAFRFNECGLRVNVNSLNVREEFTTTDVSQFTLYPAPTSNVTITLTFDSANIEVDTGSGFGPSPHTLTLTPANANAGVTLTVRAIDDNVVEGFETLTITTSATSSSQSRFNGLEVPDISVDVVDDDVGSVAFSPASVSQTEANTTMSFTATLSKPVRSGVTVEVNTAVGTATAADFTPIVNGTVSFPANSNADQTVNVTINNDLLHEGDESFTAQLSNLSATGVVSLSGPTATGTILDDDPAPTLSITSPSQPEGDAGPAAMNFEASLSAVSGLDVSFTAATADGTATVADNDYQPLAPSIFTISAGQTEIIIPVTINGDTTAEFDESYSLNLTAISNATPSELTATGTLLNDDAEPTTLVISSDDPDPSVVGQPYIVVVTVSGTVSSPSGMIMVNDGAGPGSATCGPVALVGGASPQSTASCMLTSTSAGGKTLTAQFTPDSGDYLPSSETEAHQVDPAATSIAVTGPARSRINTATVFDFQLAVTAPGAGVPQGTVTLSGGGSSCQVAVPTATPSCPLSFSALGTETISASFAPSDANFLESDSTGGNAETVVYAEADLDITKSSATTTYSPGDLLVFTIQVRNFGADAAANIRIIDNVPSGMIDVAWTCDGGGGVACPQDSGEGDLDATVGVFPVGGLLNYSFFGTVDGSPAQIANTALIELPADGTIEDLITANNSASDTDRLDALLEDGFEDPLVNAASGSYALPGGALRSQLEAVAVSVYQLDDVNGVAAHVYARVYADQLQYAIAQRNAQGQWRLRTWQPGAGALSVHWLARPSREVLNCAASKYVEPGRRAPCRVGGEARRGAQRSQHACLTDNRLLLTWPASLAVDRLERAPWPAAAGSLSSPAAGLAAQLWPPCPPAGPHRRRSRERASGQAASADAGNAQRRPVCAGRLSSQCRGLQRLGG